MTRKKIAVGLVLAGLLIGVPATAQTDFITNGGFETVVLKSGATNPSTGVPNGQMGYNVNATGWTTTGYNFLFGAGVADTTGATGESGNLKLWGPNGGTGNSAYSNNGMPTASPLGGVFLAADGAYETQPITQNITGLTVGMKYRVSFYWAGAQQSGFNGATTDMWSVALIDSVHSTTVTQNTDVVSLGSHGFSPWKYQAFDYIATSTSEMLSFLATGTPTGTPPFALLDGVKMVATPEPSPIIPMSIAVLGLGFFVHRRRRARAKQSVA